MSGDGSKTLAWGDGEYTFRLGIGELRELQDKCGAGPFLVLRRLLEGTWLIDDVLQTIRLGLIGGGLDATRALGKVGKYVAPTQFAENRLVACTVLSTSLFGDPEDIVGKDVAAARAAMDTIATASNSQPSSAPVPQSDGPLGRSTAPAYGNSPQPLTAGTDATGLTMANGRNR